MPPSQRAGSGLACKLCLRLAPWGLSRALCRPGSYASSLVHPQRLAVSAGLCVCPPTQQLASNCMHTCTPASPPTTTSPAVPHCRRYTSKEVFTAIHRTSDPFLAFKQAQGQLPFTVEVTGQSYLETNYGFMDRH